MKQCKVAAKADQTRNSIGSSRAVGSVEPRSEPLRAWARFCANRLAVVSLTVLVFLILLAVLAPVINDHVLKISPNHMDVFQAYASPSGEHLLGTDELGRDVLARLLVGCRVTLTIGVMVVLVSSLVGTTIGVVSGYFGGAVDGILMRLNDTLLAIPPLFFLLAVVSYASKLDVLGIIVVIGLTSWMWLARMIRGEVLSIIGRDYILAARAIGVPTRYVILRYLLPNTLPTLIVALTLRVGFAILTESSLSFLGLGVQPPTASWGNMLMNAQLYVWKKPSLALYPGVAIMVTVLIFNFVGDGLRETLDPRLRV